MIFMMVVMMFVMTMVMMMIVMFLMMILVIMSMMMLMRMFMLVMMRILPSEEWFELVNDIPQKSDRIQALALLSHLTELTLTWDALDRGILKAVLLI